MGFAFAAQIMEVKRGQAEACPTEILERLIIFGSRVFGALAGVANGLSILSDAMRLDATGHGGLEMGGKMRLL